MKQLIFTALLASAVLARQPSSPGKFDPAIHMSGQTTILSMETTPVFFNNQVLCPYAGRIVYPANNFQCDIIHIHHLAKVVPENKNGKWIGLHCFYDLNLSYKTTYMTANALRSDCPDILVSSGKFNFIDSIFFDFNEHFDVYFDNREVVDPDIFANDDVFNAFPELKKQVIIRNKVSQDNNSLRKF